MTTLLFDQDYADTMRYHEAEQKGRAEGIAERGLEIAQKLLNRGCDLKIIADATGLTLAQVKALGKKKSTRKMRQKKSA